MASIEKFGLGQKLDALTLIIAQPIFPAKEECKTAASIAVYDMLSKWIKPFAVLKMRRKFKVCLKLLTKSNVRMNALMDDREMIATDARVKLLNVWTYYARQIADFSKINSGQNKKIVS